MPINCASQHGQDVVQSTLKCDAAPTSQTTRSGKRTAATAGVGMSLTNSKAAKLYKIKIIPDARAAATARKRYNSAVDRVNSKHSKHRVTQPTSPAVYTRSDTFWASAFIGYQHGYVFKLSDQGTGYYLDRGGDQRHSHREHWVDFSASDTAEQAISFWQAASDIRVHSDTNVAQSGAVSQEDVERADAFLSSIASESGVITPNDLQQSQQSLRELKDGTARQKKSAADAFNASQAMWTWPVDVLKAQQAQSADWSLSDRAARFPWVLPIRATARWHVNATVSETLEFCATAPDVITYECPLTKHVPVAWYHGVQRQRSVEAFIDPPISCGPEVFCKYWQSGQQYFGVGPADMCHGFGVAVYGEQQTDCYMPEAMLDLFYDKIKWHQAHEWVDATVAEVQRVQKGYKFKASNLPGGRDGVDFGIEALYQQYRRVVWRNENGTPVPVENELPDKWTEIRVFDLYRDAEIYGVPDKEIVSMLALYGLQSRTACSPTSTFVPNYAEAWMHLEIFEETLRAKQNDFGNFPRLTATTRWLQFWPTRFCPKSIVHQIKDNGKEKDRPVTDAGARRTKGRRDRLENVHRSNVSKSKVRNLIGAARDLQKSSTAKPGPDSPNACMPEETFLAFRWGKASALAQAMDILLSSGLKVDVIVRDFKGWYEQWARTNTEHHLCGQLTSTYPQWDTQACFGWSDCAHLLNRANFAVLHVIEVELEAAQRDFPIEDIDLDDCDKSKLLAWTRARHSAGFSGNWWSCLPFFDDNSIACISLGAKWTARVEQIVDSVWEKYHFQVEDDKSATNLYDTETWEPTLGRILHTRKRRTILPEAKVKRYSAGIDSIVHEATKHPKNLVKKQLAEQTFGRLLFSCDAGIPSIWRDFLALVSCVCTSWSEHFVQIGDQAQDILKHIQFKLHNENGVAFTSYTPRPLSGDSLPIVVTYTDASRKEETMTGGYGGFIWVYGSRTVHYFFGAWTSFEIEQTDINEEETVAANIAATLAKPIIAEAVRQCGVADDGISATSYLMQLGDSAVFFDHVFMSASASSHGLRYLYRARAASDADGSRGVTLTHHVERGLNQPSDDLSNAKETEFKIEIAKLLGPGLKLVKLEVPPSLASMVSLIDWKQSCSQNKLKQQQRHERAPKQMKHK